MDKLEVVKEETFISALATFLETTYLKTFFQVLNLLDQMYDQDLDLEDNKETEV